MKRLRDKIIAYLAKRYPAFCEKHNERLCNLQRMDWNLLPQMYLTELFPDLEERPVTLHRLPRGKWSSPVADVILLLKLVASLQPRKCMEVGSFRGYTALAIASHLPEDGMLVTLDQSPQHGEAYREHELARKIERRIGKTSAEMFERDQPGSYDFIFLDASHRYENVKRDTAFLLPLLAPRGVLVWHDYSNWGRYTGINGVPKYLHELAAQIPVAHVDGTSLALYCPSWGTQTGRFEKIIASRDNADMWETTTLR